MDPDIQGKWVAHAKPLLLLQEPLRKLGQCSHWNAPWPIEPKSITSKSVNHQATAVVIESITCISCRSREIKRTWKLKLHRAWIKKSLFSDTHRNKHYCKNSVFFPCFLSQSDSQNPYDEKCETHFETSKNSVVIWDFSTTLDSELPHDALPSKFLRFRSSFSFSTKQHFKALMQAWF